MPWFTSSRQRCTPPADEEPVEEQQEHCAEHRSNDPGTSSRIAVPTERSANEPGEQRAGDTQQDRNQKAARITSRHEQFGDSADNEPDDQGPQESHNASEVG